MISPTEARPRTIPVSEIFGPTLEGEGPWAGQPTYFLRLGGCDYSCLWCDTDQAVVAAKVRELPRLTIEQLWQRLFDYTRDHPGPDLLAISGGNPGLYDLSEIVTWWQTQDRSANGHNVRGMHKVLVETQGSRWQPWFRDVDLLTVSPKAPSSGLQSEQSMKNLSRFLNEHGHQDNMLFKVVVFDETDYQFARLVHVVHPAVPFHLSTGTAMGGLDGQWVPAAGTPIYRDNALGQKPEWLPMTPQSDEFGVGRIDDRLQLLDRYRWLAERAMKDPVMADVQVQVQLHCLLWGITTKGV